MNHRFVVLLLVLTMTACAHTVERRNWSDYEGPGKEAFETEELPLLFVPDPIEPMNRTVSAINHGLMIGIIDPLAQVYTFLTPKWFRAGVQNFGANLVYPRRLVNNVLQGKWAGARDETYRFGINTVLGIAGIIDVAGFWGIEPSDEDFGQTLSVWGWENSTYMMLPFAGPSSIRDTTGLIPDMAMNLATYSRVPMLTTAIAFNDASDKTDAYKFFVATHHDGYQLGRLAYTIAREERATDFEYTPENTGQVQTLQALFLDIKDPDYRGDLETGEVEIPGTDKTLPYSYRMQEEPAPILFMIPGTGAHRLEGSPLALTEMAWDRGFSVATLSSTINFEFMEHGASVALPGHAPQDARDTHVAIDAMFRDLDARYPGKIGKRVLMGYSLGAFHTFFIAAAEADPDNALIDFDRYVSLDAPVDLVYALGILDSFYNAPMAFPPEERDFEVRNILYKVMDMAERQMGTSGAESGSEDDSSEAVARSAPVEEDVARLEIMEMGEHSMAPTGLVPLSNLEAEFLIGLAFRNTLSTAIYSSQDREDLGVLQTPRGWFRRVSAYQEIGEYSFTEYIYAFLMPYYQTVLGRGDSVEALLRANDLRSLEGALRANDRIRHYSNRNDFLTTDDDLVWLSEVLGESNVTIREEGGHLGNMYRPDVQEDVMSSITDLLDPPGSLVSSGTEAVSAGLRLTVE